MDIPDYDPTEFPVPLDPAEIYSGTWLLKFPMRTT